MKIALTILAIVGYTTSGCFFTAGCTSCRNSYAKKCRDANPGDVQDEVKTRGASNRQDLEVYCNNGEGETVTIKAKRWDTGRYYVSEDKACDAMKAMDCSAAGGAQNDNGADVDLDLEEGLIDLEEEGSTNGGGGDISLEDLGLEDLGSESGNGGGSNSEGTKPSGQSAAIDTTKFEKKYKRCNSKGAKKAVKKFTKQFKKDVPDCVEVTADGENVVISCCCGKSETIKCEEKENRKGQMKMKFNMADFFQKLNGICGECAGCSCS